MQNKYSSSAVASLMIAVVFIVLSTVAVALRIAGRRIKRTSLWYDDYMILAALSVSGGWIPPVKKGDMLNLSGVTNGDSGQPSRSIPREKLSFLFKDLLAIQFLWVTSILLVKLGILLFYLRIFTKTRDCFAAQVTMGVAACWWVAGVFAVFFSCRPFSYNWNRNQPGNCDANFTYWIAIAISHMIIDVIILLLPLPMVWTLQVPLRTKFGLSILLALGLFVCIISGIRISAIYKASDGDISQGLPIMHIWSFVEPTVAICTSCLPVARPLFSKYFLSVFNSFKSSKSLSARRKLISDQS